jgi:hypothetical protein
MQVSKIITIFRLKRVKVIKIGLLALYSLFIVTFGANPSKVIVKKSQTEVACYLDHTRSIHFEVGESNVESEKPTDCKPLENINTQLSRQKNP